MICMIYRLPIRSGQIFKLGTPCSKTIRAWARVSLHETLRVDQKKSSQVVWHTAADLTGNNANERCLSTTPTNAASSLDVSCRDVSIDSVPGNGPVKSGAQQTENESETPKTSGRKRAICEMDMADLDDLNDDFGLFTPSKKKGDKPTSGSTTTTKKAVSQEKFLSAITDMVKQQSVQDTDHTIKMMEFLKDQDRQRMEYQRNMEEMNLAQQIKFQNDRVKFQEEREQRRLLFEENVERERRQFEEKRDRERQECEERRERERRTYEEKKSWRDENMKRNGRKRGKEKKIFGGDRQWSFKQIFSRA